MVLNIRTMNTLLSFCHYYFDSFIIRLVFSRCEVSSISAQCHATYYSNCICGLLHDTW